MTGTKTKMGIKNKGEGENEEEEEEKAKILSRDKRVVGAEGWGRRCVGKRGGKITACLTNWLHRGKAFLYFAHTHREHALASKARLQPRVPSILPSSSSSPAPCPCKSGGRNKATGNHPSGTLAWWWRHLVPLDAEFYGGETCTHCSCNQVVRRCGLSPLLVSPFDHPFYFLSM